MASDKTNVMRVLEQHKIAYKPHEYPHGKDAVDGVSVAELLGQNPDQVFKTLVARGKSGGFHVFVIPVAKELDLKKAAKAAGEKSVEMVHVKELLGLTGYVRGGCSPVGMKKAFPTVFDESVNNVPTVMVSAGKIGFQIECTGGSHQADTRRDRAYHDGLKQYCMIKQERFVSGFCALTIGNT
ncbi:Cys-tRNA(Pro) deacylase [Agathobaculum butyriciproducens]|uniref:Cys-tRNA(Pro) deacylase n=1 Tax=Agathobaculum butyriciproducens TaxID=1628085 RepID=UPI0036D2193F